MPGFDSDVVISQIKEFSTVAPTPRIIASTKTQKHLAASSSSGASVSDPWLQPSADPWAKKQVFKSTLPANPGKSRLAEIKEQLCEDVTQKVRQQLEEHAGNMEVDSGANNKDPATEARLQALEVGLTEIKQQNTQFLTWFHEAGDRMKQTEQAVGDLQHSMVQQQQDLQQLNTSVSHSVKSMKDELSREMSTSFQQQMTELTALLEKRQCREASH